MNPVLGRKSIPAIAKGGLIMALTFCVYSTNPDPVMESVTLITYGILLIKEFAIGYVVGFVMELYEFMFTFAGAIIDFQIGLSMSNVYDPQTNTQIPLSGSIWAAYYAMLFLAVDGHLVLIKILVTSGQIIPYGEIAIAPGAAEAMLNIFTQCVILAIKFSFPITAIEFLTQIAVGILMKVIPQINVFVVNIQMKVLIGIVMMLFLFLPMLEFTGTIIDEMLSATQYILNYF